METRYHNARMLERCSREIDDATIDDLGRGKEDDCTDIDCHEREHLNLVRCIRAGLPPLRANMSETLLVA